MISNADVPQFGVGLPTPRSHSQRYGCLLPTPLAGKPSVCQRGNGRETVPQLVLWLDFGHGEQETEG